MGKKIVEGKPACLSMPSAEHYTITLKCAECCSGGGERLPEERATLPEIQDAKSPLPIIFAHNYPQANVFLFYNRSLRSSGFSQFVVLAV